MDKNVEKIHLLRGLLVVFSGIFLLVSQYVWHIENKGVLSLIFIFVSYTLRFIVTIIDPEKDIKKEPDD